MFSFGNCWKSSNYFDFSVIKRNSSRFRSTHWLFRSIDFNLWQSFIETTKNCQQFNDLYRSNSEWILSNFCWNKTNWLDKCFLNIHWNSTQSNTRFSIEYNKFSKKSFFLSLISLSFLETAIASAVISPIIVFLVVFVLILLGALLFVYRRRHQYEDTRSFSFFTEIILYIRIDQKKNKRSSKSIRQIIRWKWIIFSIKSICKSFHKRSKSIMFRFRYSLSKKTPSTHAQNPFSK